MTNFRWGSATDIGQVRQNNQDAVLSDDGLFLVADGMGGHRGGEVASAIAVEQVQAHFTEPTTEALVEAVQAANKAVVDRSDTEPELRGMGTTLTGLARVRSDEDEDRLAIVNVGDSRLYLLKGGTQLQQITEDHSLVATLERQGQLTKAEAAVHPHRNILTRALGIDPMVLVDSWEIMPFVGDRYLLCSDGLFNEVPEEEITRILREVDDPDAAASTLVEMANAGGGRDNITVLIVDVLTDGGNAAAADAALDRVAKATHASERVLLTPEVQAAADALADPAGAPPPPPLAASRSRVTWRVVGFLALVVLVIGFGAVVMATIASNTYYVGLDGDEVVIFRGAKGGVLWVQPSIEQRTGLLIADVPEQYRADITEGQDEPSLEDAQAFVQNVREQADELGGALGADLVLPSTTEVPDSTATSVANRDAGSDQSND